MLRQITEQEKKEKTMTVEKALIILHLPVFILNNETNDVDYRTTYRVVELTGGEAKYMGCVQSLS